MTWKRFGYICRKASVDCGDRESISECLSRIESEESCALYGSKIASGSWPRLILDVLGRIRDRQEAQALIDIYKNLNLASSFEEPMRFKRVITYLAYVSFIFYIVVAIYQLKVAPTFISAFREFELSTPGYLSIYRNYWTYFVSSLSLLLLFALLIGFQMRNLFKFELGLESSFTMRYLMVRSIRRSYLRIVSILRFPMLGHDQARGEVDNFVIAHLQSVRDAGMCVSREMQELIELEMQSLLGGCERQMKFLSIAVALIVIAAIFFFLVSAYSPLFVMGEMI